MEERWLVVFVAVLLVVRDKKEKKKQRKRIYQPSKYVP